MDAAYGKDVSPPDQLVPSHPPSAAEHLLRCGVLFAGRLALIAAMAACLWAFDWCIYHALDGSLMGLRLPGLPGFA